MEHEKQLQILKPSCFEGKNSLQLCTMHGATRGVGVVLIVFAANLL